MSFIILTFI